MLTVGSNISSFVRTLFRHHHDFLRGLALVGLLGFMITMAGCRDQECVTKVEKTVAMKVTKNSNHMSLSVDQLDFLSDSTIVWEDIELNITLKGQHKSSDKLWLAMNGLKVTRKDGRHGLDSVTYVAKKKHSISGFKLHKMFMNGSEPFDKFLRRIKKNKGQLKITFFGKNVEILEATITFNGKSYAGCNPEEPTPTPVPVAVQTTLDSVAPPQSKTSSQNILFNFSSNVDGASFMCSLDGAAAVNCGSPQSYANLDNGTHRFEVYAQSPQGIRDTTPAVYSWTVDAKAPTVSITNASELPTLTNSGAIRFEFASSKPNSVFYCSLDGAATTVCTSPMSYAALNEGVHVFTVNTKDSVGNAGKTAATFQWAIDFTPPETSFLDITPASEYSNAVTKTFTFSSNESSTFECAVDNGGYAACASPVNLENLSEGSHLIEVRAKDVAGNVGLPASYSWAVDLTAPVLASGAINPAVGITNAKNISVEFLANETVTTYCSLDGVEASQCQSPFVADNLSEGEHRVRIHAVDAAGNESAALQVQWLMDFTAPVISFGAILPSAASQVNSNQLSVEINMPADVILMASLNGQAATPAANPIVLTGLAEGVYLLSAYAADSAGNTSNIVTHTFKVDQTAPLVSLAAEITKNPSNVDRNAFAFSASEESTFECDLDGAGFSACTSPQDLTGLADGAHHFQVRATDVAGNVSEASHYEWVVDTAPPTTSITAQLDGDRILFQMSSNETKVTYDCSLDGVPISPCSKEMLYEQLSAGAHNFLAKATDAAGNQDPVGATHQFVVIKPIQTLLTSKTPPDTTTTSTSITFTFEANQSNATFRCSLDGAAYSNCSSPTTYNNLNDGNHNFIVKAVDAYGNVDSVGASHSWSTDSSGPVISNISFTATTNTITVSWTTNEPATGQIKYGVGSTLNRETGELMTLTTSHSIKLTGLSANTTYGVQILGHDYLGNLGVSTMKAAKTNR